MDALNAVVYKRTCLFAGKLFPLFFSALCMYFVAKM